MELPKINLRWSKTNFAFPAGNRAFAQALLPVLQKQYPKAQLTFSSSDIDTFFERHQGQLIIGSPNGAHILIRFFDIERKENGEVEQGYFSRLEVHGFAPPFAEAPLWLEIECLEGETGDRCSLLLESTDMEAYNAVKDCLKPLVSANK